MGYGEDGARWHGPRAVRKIARITDREHQAFARGDHNANEHIVKIAGRTRARIAATSVTSSDIFPSTPAPTTPPTPTVPGQASVAGRGGVAAVRHLQAVPARMPGYAVPAIADAR